MGALLLAFAVQLHFLRVLSRTVCTINTYRSRETQKPRRMPGWPDPACVHARTHSWAISGSAPKTLPCAFQLWGPQGKATKSNQALIFTGAQVLRGLSCSVALNLPDFEVMYIESSNKKREPLRVPISPRLVSELSPRVFAPGIFPRSQFIFTGQLFPPVLILSYFG